MNGWTSGMKVGPMAVGDWVRIRALSDHPAGEIIEIIPPLLARETTYRVRYQRDGATRSLRFFADEIEVLHQ